MAGRATGVDVIGDRPMRVLLVDDSEDMRLLFRLALGSDPSFKVCGEATNGVEAIALVATACPDAIVLDITMPVMDGLTALPFLRDLCPTVPVIIVTAGATHRTRLDAFERGAYAVLDLGAAIDQLKPLLEAACPRSSRGPGGGAGEGASAEETPRHPRVPMNASDVAAKTRS